MNVNYNWWVSKASPTNQQSGHSEIETNKSSFSQSKNWLMMALLLMFSFSFAQTVTIGSGTATNSNVPINYNWGYNYTQTIYTAAEMTAAGASATGTITSIKFKPTSSVSTALWKDWVVYLGNTSKDGFTTTTDWIALGSLTEVFNGSLVANTVANSWMEITLTTPFNWTGGNLVIAVDENTASYGGDPSWASYTLAPTTGNKSIYYRNDSTNPSPSTPPTASGRSNVVGQIQFVFPSATVPNCAISHVPVAAATGVARNATLSWVDGGGGPTSYDVYFGASTSPSFAANVVGTSYTPPTMAANTSYYWRVVPKNANGEAVGGCTERSFTTGTGYNYCAATVTNSGDRTSAFSTTLAVTNIAYTASSNPTNGYTDQTAQDFQVGQGTSFNFSHTYVGGANGVKAWIDYNNDGTFGAGEDVYFLADSNATKTGTITVPLATSLGTYRMRVRSQYGSSAEPTACGNLSYGTTMDYTITVIAPPSCIAPTTLASSAVTASSATLSWTASASSPSNGYDIYYSTTNTAPLAGTTPTVDNHTASPYNVSGLTSATTYYWWVRSDCGAETSVWASGGSFKTSLNYCAGDHFYDTGGVSGTYSSSENVTTVIAPTAGNLVTVTFASFNTESGWDYLKVYDGPTAASPALHTGSGFSGTSIPGPFTSTHPSGTLTFVFTSDGSGNYDGWDATVTCSPLPTCLAPTALASSAVTATTATLSWTAASPVPASGYDIYYSTTNTAPTALTTPTVENHTASPLNATGLNSSSTYYWWVRSDCSGGDVSDWVSGGNFITLCAVESTPTAVQGFATYLPNCWSEAAGALTASSTLTGTSSKWFGSTGMANTGSNTAVKTNLYGGSTGSPNNDWLISNQIDLGPTVGTKQLKFDYAVTNWNGTVVQSTLGTHTVKVVVSTDGGATWSDANVIKTYTGAATYSNTGVTETILLNYSGVVKIGFLATTTSTSPDIDFHIDNVLVQTAPTDTPDYVNLQFPSSTSVLAGENSENIYARVYEAGLTDATSGQAPGIEAWIGISPIGADASSNPNTWTTWVPATFFGETDGNNNDEYKANIGATLAVGTYRYASRFQLNGGPFVYGGYEFNAWNGTTSNSGVLTVNANPTQCASLVAPANAATNVTKGTVALSWTAPASGPAPTGYKVYFGTTSGALTLMTTTTNLTYNASAPAFSTTYYWSVVPTSVIGGGDAVGCSERSFTTQADPFAPYCSNVVYSSTVEPITKVTFAGIDNSSSASTIGGASLENFIAISGNVTTENSYTMTLKGNTDGDFTSYFTIFIDWNQDGDFLDAGETINGGSITDTDGTDVIQAVTSITVPGSALAGQTRMRIKKLFNSASTDACTGGSYGQSEDYTLNVTLCTPSNWYADADGDGYGTDASLVSACFSPGANYVLLGGDCNDGDNTINPGAIEICYDGIDQNCDGSMTDGCPVITATLRAENCGELLTSLNQVVRGNSYSQSIPNGVTVTGYRFRVTNLLTNAVRILDRSNYVFQLTYTDFAEYNTPYSVEVALRLNQEWMEVYGAACTITTPGVPNTVLASTSCGATLVQMNNIIRAEVVPSALNYEYNVALIEGGFPVATTTLVRSGASFNLLQLTGIPIKFAAEYSVTIRVQVPTSSGPQWSTVAGAACSVFTPFAPEASIEGCGGESGITPANLNTVVYASPVGGATQYRFTLTDGLAYNQVYTTPSRFFKLSNFNALSPLTAGGTYSVTVEVAIYGNYYAGKDCNILVPGGVGRPITPITRTTVGTDMLMGEFKAVAYPNPFNNSFALDLKTNNTTPVSLAIYDMTGRLLETREIKVDGLSSQTIGERYPSGVYNVLVNQGENTQTIRVVKQ